MGTNYWLNKTTASQNETRLILLRTVMMVGGIVALLIFQISYFNKVDTFYDYRCEYYDEHYNLIFSNPRIHHCPDLIVQTDTNDTLSFTTNASYNASDDLSSYVQFGVQTLEHPTYISVSSTTYTLIHYNDSFDIVYYETQISEIITFQEDSGMDTLYFSTSKITENMYVDDAFSTTLSTATTFEPYTDEAMVHTVFDESDYDTVTTYTTNDAPLDAVVDDADAYLLQSINNSEPNTIAYGLSDYTFYNVEGDLESFSYVDRSNWSQTATYYRVSSGDRINSEGYHKRHYALGYELQDDGYYKLMSKQFQEPDEYRFESNQSWSFGNITFTEDGHDCYHVLDGIYYKFIKTDYGMKVVDRRNQQFTLFKSLKKQQLETNLDYFNDQFLLLHDYYKNMTNYPYHMPQILIKKTNPLFNTSLINH
jgi:hypothetical protein